jgi:hypothetical protein
VRQILETIYKILLDRYRTSSISTSRGEGHIPEVVADSLKPPTRAMIHPTSGAAKVKSPDGDTDHDGWQPGRAWDERTSKPIVVQTCHGPSLWPPRTDRAVQQVQHEW